MGSSLVCVGVDIMTAMGTVLAQASKKEAPPTPPTSHKGSLQPETQQAPDWKVNAVKGSWHRVGGARPALTARSVITLGTQGSEAGHTVWLSSREKLSRRGVEQPTTLSQCSSSFLSTSF